MSIAERQMADLVRQEVASYKLTPDHIVTGHSTDVWSAFRPAYKPGDLLGRGPTEQSATPDLLNQESKMSGQMTRDKIRV
jgi:hypothetical protein